jgi:hypothetical protein
VTSQEKQRIKEKYNKLGLSPGWRESLEYVVFPSRIKSLGSVDGESHYGWEDDNSDNPAYVQAI